MYIYINSHILFSFCLINVRMEKVFRKNIHLEKSIIFSLTEMEEFDVIHCTIIQDIKYTVVHMDDYS